MMKRKIRMGMVGGGPGSFIGGVHRMAARLDGRIEFACGAFSRNPELNRSMAKELFIPESKCYSSFAEMYEKEKQLPPGERMDFVAIATPNVTHFDAAMGALENGFHVMCDKPMTYTLDQAMKLRDKVRETGLVFALMHNYSAYPMVRQAKEMIAAGKIGKLRKIIAEYDLGWLAAPNAGKQAAWRCDPKQSGIAACTGDIGTHAEHLLEFISGLRITDLCADLSTFVEGRKLDDDGTILLRFDNGARGVIEISEVASGEENQFKVRFYGTEGSLEWFQQQPENLIFRSNSAPMMVYRRSWAEFCPDLACDTRLPAGHPEGFIEAFANIYSDFAKAIEAHDEGRAYTPSFPTVDDGVRGMNFITTVVKSSKSDSKWTPLEKI